MTTCSISADKSYFYFENLLTQSGTHTTITQFNGQTINPFSNRISVIADVAVWENSSLE